MIISKTPYRVSLLGGGADFPEHFNKYGATIVGGAINHHAYITVKDLPPFHEYKTRVVYQDVECVKSNKEVKHKIVSAVFDYLGVEEGLEIFHMGGLPGRSGTGSSSTFLVGLLNALSSYQGKHFTPAELARISTEIERKHSSVGFQDQLWACFGGLSYLQFQKNEADVISLNLSGQHQLELENHLLLFFSGIPRLSSDIAKNHLDSLTEKTRELKLLTRWAQEGIEAILAKRWDRLGFLVDQSWKVKRSTAGATNQSIESMYERARIGGAWGAKLTGAGGGGCLLAVAPPEKHAGIRELLSDLVEIPFRFVSRGSHILHTGEEITY